MEQIHKEGRSVLYVDDEQSSLNAFKNLYRRKFNIITASSGQKGLEILEAQPVQVIVTDQRMPEMTGIEFLKKVRNKWPGIKCILFTAFDEKEVIKKAINEAGIYWYLNKPFEPDQLEQIVMNASDAYHADNKLKESEEKFRGVFESMTDVFTRSDMNGKCVLISPSIYKMIGYKPEEIIGKNLAEFYADPEQRTEIVNELKSSKGAKNFEIDIVRKDGKLITVSANAKMYYNSKGEVSGIESIFRDITEQKQAEAEILKNKIHLQKAQEIGQFGSWELDLINDKLFWSDMAYKIFEIEYETPLNYKVFLECIYPEDREFVNQSWQNALNTGNYDIEHRILAGSSVKWVREIAQLVYDENKQAAQGIGVVQDITARKKAETELREKEETLHTLLNAPLEVIMLVNRDGIVLSTNKGGANSFGISKEELVGQSIYQYMPENVAQIRKSIGEEVFKTGKAMHFEDEREGQFFASSIYPVFDASGEKVISLAVFASNITDRKMMERELIESEAKYRNLVDNALIGVFHTKTNGQFIFVNQALSQMYDYDDPEHMMGEKTLLHWVDPKRREQFILALQEGGSVSNFEAETISHTGRYIHILISATLEADNISGMVMDITEQKKTELQILDYQKRLKDLAQELTLSEEKIRKQIAVDLHDHVGQMLSSSRMQLAKVVEMEKNPEIESRIKDISGALLTAIQATRAAIFDLSPPQLNEIGLYAAVHDWMKEQIERKHGINTIISGEQVKFHLEGNARILIFRSIKELMMNAVKHARASQLMVDFTIMKEMLEVTVQDDGVGFNYNPDLIKLKGNSYGLFSIQERITDLGGKVIIDSVIDQGTKAILLVPLQNNLP